MVGNSSRGMFSPMAGRREGFDGTEPSRLIGNECSSGGMLGRNTGMAVGRAVAGMPTILL
ncbi:hypothetical protein GOP47_0029248 [Adiantum capillus-veneris]|nr:hypothetical protein GOP47_0029248 [Adiantum capillus-veneris]